MADSRECDCVASESIFLLGLDGATWAVLQPLIDQRALPHIGDLVERGVHGTLETLDCLISPVIWTSIATGKSPAKHGIHSFSAQKVGPKVINLEWRWKKLLVERLYPFYNLVKRVGVVKSIPPSSKMRTAKTVWEILENRPHQTGVVGWWGTWPPAPLSGGIVSDRAYNLLEGSTYPESLLDEISSFRVHHKDISPSVVREFLIVEPSRETEFASASVPEDRWFGYAYLSDVFFSGALRHLIHLNPSSSYFAYLRGIDLLEHAFWNYVQPDAFPHSPTAENANRYGHTVANYYKWIDSLLGGFLDSLVGEHLVIVVSDHGMRPAPFSENPGDHDPEAIFIAAGPNVAHRPQRLRGHILDVVPTVLYLMGLPVGRDMDGVVITDAVEQKYLHAHPISYIDSYEDERREAEYVQSDADQEIIEHLRGLGYID